MTVAIIGASSDHAKFGNKAVRAYTKRGHTVYPVNPNEREIEGLASYRSVLDIEGAVDRASFYVPADVGLTLLDDVAQKGVREVFFNPGSESPGLLARASALGLQWKKACSIRAIGESPDAYP